LVPRSSRETPRGRDAAGCRDSGAEKMWGRSSSTTAVHQQPPGSPRADRRVVARPRCRLASTARSRHTPRTNVRTQGSSNASTKVGGPLVRHSGRYGRPMGPGVPVGEPSTERRKPCSCQVGAASARARRAIGHRSPIPVSHHWSRSHSLGQQRLMDRAGPQTAGAATGMCSGWTSMWHALGEAYFRR